MADLTEQILFSIKTDYSDLLKQSTDLKSKADAVTTAIKSQKVELAALAAQGKQNTDSYKYLSVEMKANELTLSALNKQQSQTNSQIQAGIQLNTQQKGSLTALRAELANMKKAYADLSEEERNNVNIGGVMLKQLTEQNDKVKSLESAYGDNQRNVGNYKDAILNASASLKIFGVDLGQIKAGFEKTKEGINIAKTGMQSFDGVVKASALGVLILLITGVIAVFTRFQPVVDKVEQVMGGINAAFDVFTGALIKLGQGVIETVIGYFTGLIETGKALFKLLTGDLDGAVDTMTHSFDRLKGGVDAMRGSFDGLGGAMKNAFDVGQKIVQMQQDIDDLNRKNIITNSELSKQIDQLLLQSRNRSLSAKEQLSLLDQASKKEKEAFANTKLAADAELLIAQTKYDMAIKNKTLNDAIENARANAIAKVNNLESESINLLEKIQNRRDAVLDKEAARIKAEEDKRKAAADKLAADLDKARQNQIEEDAKFQQFLVDQENEANKEIENNYKQHIKALTDTFTKGNIADLALQKKFESDKLKEQLAFQNQQLALLKKNGKDTTDAELAIANTQLEIKKNELSNTQKFDAGKIKSAISVAGAVQDILTDVIAHSAASVEEQKAVALTGVAINLGSAIANLVATTTAPTPDNVVTGGISGFVKYATFLAQVIASITSAQSIIGGAAAGGGSFKTTGPTLMLVGDNPGGVERIDVTPLSGRGQTVVNPNSNLIKMAGGGSLTVDGGFAARSLAGTNNLIDYNMLAKAMASVKTVVSVDEINSQQGKKKRKVGVSTLG